MGKGSSSKAEQQAADARTASQDALQHEALHMQEKQLSDVNAVADPMIARGGMSAEQEAAMNSLLMNTLPQTFRNTAGQINQSLVARGISGGAGGAGSGDVARDFGQLGAMQGALQQQGLSNIQLQKAAQLQNLLGLKMGIGSQFGGNVGVFGQGASSAMNAGVNAANNADQAQTSWMGPVFGALGSIGSGIGMGGFGKGGAFGCWIAAAVFDGWDDPRVHFVREQLWNRAENELIFKLITKLYMAIGEKVSLLTKKYTWLRRAMFKLFDGFMRDECDRILNEAVNG